MLLGIWDNIEDLENKLNLQELRAILDASRKREHEKNRFLAAIQGIDIDAQEKESNKEKFDAIQERVNRKLYGAKAVESDDLNFFGLDMEYED